MRGRLHVIALAKLRVQGQRRLQLGRCGRRIRGRVNERRVEPDLGVVGRTLRRERDQLYGSRPVSEEVLDPGQRVGDRRLPGERQRLLRQRPGTCGILVAHGNRVGKVVERHDVVWLELQQLLVASLGKVVLLIGLVEQCQLQLRPREIGSQRGGLFERGARCGPIAPLDSRIGERRECHDLFIDALQHALQHLEPAPRKQAG